MEHQRLQEYPGLPPPSPRQQPCGPRSALLSSPLACTRQHDVMDPEPLQAPRFGDRSNVLSRSVYTETDALPDGHDSGPSSDRLLAHGLHFSMPLRRFLDSGLIRRNTNVVGLIDAHWSVTRWVWFRAPRIGPCGEIGTFAIDLHGRPVTPSTPRNCAQPGSQL